VYVQYTRYSTADGTNSAPGMQSCAMIVQYTFNMAGERKLNEIFTLATFRLVQIE
jgi:hypothetical protein